MKVSKDAPICPEFTRDGWCPVKAGECPKLHVWECGEWRETGRCSRDGKCGLRHVLRAEKGRGSKVEVEKDGLDNAEVQLESSAEGEQMEMPVEVDLEGVKGFEEQAEFIGFGEQGRPAAPTLESEEDEEVAEESGEGDAEGGDEDMGTDESSEDDDEEEQGADDDANEEVGEEKDSLEGANLSRKDPLSSHPDMSMDTDEEEDEVLES